MMKLQIPEWYVNGQNQWYVQGKFLEVGVGNNAFSLPKKADRERLEITPLKVGSLDDLKLAKQVAFQDYEGDQWLECVGLESAILCLDYPIPIYFFDNHNHVFYAWAEALKMGWFEKGAMLVHMDEHFDAAEPVIPPTPDPLETEHSLDHWQMDVNDLENVWKYTNQVLQIATYIKPALKLGMFSECIDYVESKHFESFSKERGYPSTLSENKLHRRRGSISSHQQVVLNLDIDVFHPDMSHISWQQKIDVLKYYLPQTKLITMATSPYFIDQQKAIQLVKRVVDELF